MEHESIGKFIRKLRKEKGYTIVELSKLSGVSNPYISQIENDKFKPSPEILEKLSKVLDASYLELLKKAGYISTDFLEKEQKLKSLRNELNSNLEDLKALEDLNNIGEYTDLIKQLKERNLIIEHKISKLSQEQVVEITNSQSNTKEMIDLEEILKSNVQIEFNEKILSDDDKKKLLAIAKTIFSE